MAAGNAKALRALVAVTLVSFLLVQGVAGIFECCYCNCYAACKKRNRPKLECHSLCFNNTACSFSCKNACRGHSSNGDGDDVGVAIASGGGSLGMVNGTGAFTSPPDYVRDEICSPFWNVCDGCDL